MVRKCVFLALKSPCRAYRRCPASICTVQWSRCGTSHGISRSGYPGWKEWHCWGRKWAKRKRGTSEITAQYSTHYCPCDGTETFNTSHTLKGLKLGRKFMNAEVAYVFHPDHNFSQNKKKGSVMCQEDCGPVVVGQGWQP